MSNRLYNYIAKTVPFGGLEEFLNHFAEHGYVLVSNHPATIDVSHREAETEDGKEGATGTLVYDKFNVVMAQYVGPRGPEVQGN